MPVDTTAACVHTEANHGRRSLAAALPCREFGKPSLVFLGGSGTHPHAARSIRECPHVGVIGPIRRMVVRCKVLCQHWSLAFPAGVLRGFFAIAVPSTRNRGFEADQQHGAVTPCRRPRWPVRSVQTKGWQTPAHYAQQVYSAVFQPNNSLATCRPISPLLDCASQTITIEKPESFWIWWSGREDSNLRPLGPEPSALPG